MTSLGLTLLIISTGVIGSVSTFLLSAKTNWSTVRSSAFLSLLVAIAFSKLAQQSGYAYLSEIPLVFIGASFVGMTAPSKLNVWGIFLAGTLFGIIYHLIPSIHFGAGGTMGAAASVSVLSVYGVRKIFSAYGTKKRGSIAPLD